MGCGLWARNANSAQRVALSETTGVSKSGHLKARCWIATEANVARVVVLDDEAGRSGVYAGVSEG